MARYIGPVCRLCRSAGEKLFLKGERCQTTKCAIEKRNTKPGNNRQLKGKESEYAIQLREKQKIKRTYGLLEAQFFNYYKKANDKTGVTGDFLMQTLERRLDNVIYRLGAAPSRANARQVVRHGGVKIDGKKVDIPSYLVSVGELITVNKSSDAKIPSWLSKEAEGFKVIALPNNDNYDANLNPQMVVEFYSR